MPGHTSREVLIIFSSLTTCDPSNIYDLIKVGPKLKLDSRGDSVVNLLLVVRTLFFKVIIYKIFLLKSFIFLDLMKTLKAAKIRVSVIGLSAEVRVCTVLARETGGKYLLSSITVITM